MSQPTHEYLVPTAKSVLGVPGDASLADCKQAFLWRLEEEECNPSPDLIEAASLLGVIDGNAASFSLMQTRFEIKVNQCLDEFIGDYWTLNPESRRAEWERLNEISQSLPRQRQRLSELIHGLNLELPADADGVFEPVFRCLNRAYLAPATIRRQAVITIAEENNSTIEDLTSMVLNFESQHPQFTEVLNFLEIGKNIPGITVRTGADKRRRKEKPIDYLGNAIFRLEKKSDRKSYIAAFLIVIIVIIMRIAFSKESNPPLVVPPVQFPSIEPRRFSKENEFSFPKMEPKTSPKSIVAEMLVPDSPFKGSMPKTITQGQTQTNNP